MKKLLLVAFGAVAVLGVFLWISDERAGHGALQGVAPAGVTPVAEAETPFPPVPSEASRVPERAAVAPTEEVTVPDSTPPPASSGTAEFSLSGTITVVDEQGIEHAAEDGAFLLYVYEGESRSRGIQVQVRAGAWSAQETELELGAGRVEVAALEILLGDRPAFLEGQPDQQLALEGRSFLALRARRYSPVVLHVQDRETGQELREVELVEQPEFGMVAHPGLEVPAPLLVADSPLVIQPPGNPLRPTFTPSAYALQRFFHARSPGYAWARVEIDPMRTEERFLLLDRGGSLSIAVRGSGRDARTMLRLAKASESSTYKVVPFFEAALGENDILEIEALPAGTYRVRAELGDSSLGPKVLGEAEAEVVAGQRAELVLALETTEPMELVPLEGTLELPVEWGLDDSMLMLELLDEPLDGSDGLYLVQDIEALEGVPGRFHWDAGEVQAGRYQVSFLLDSPPFSTSLVVGPQGEHEARIVVPPPCDVSVRCVDEATGVDVDVDQLSWSQRSAGGSLGDLPQSAIHDVSRRRWSLRTPAGEIVLWIIDARFEYQQQAVEVGPGANEFVLRLAPTTGLLLGFRDGDTEVAFDYEWNVELRPVDEVGTFIGSLSVDARVLLSVKEPGTYRLTLGEIPGYEPVPEQTFEIERGIVREHVIELQRRR